MTNLLTSCLTDPLPPPHSMSAHLVYRTLSPLHFSRFILKEHPAVANLSLPACKSLEGASLGSPRDGRCSIWIELLLLIIFVGYRFPWLSRHSNACRPCWIRLIFPALAPSDIRLHSLTSEQGGKSAFPGWHHVDEYSRLPEKVRHFLVFCRVPL